MNHGAIFAGPCGTEDSASASLRWERALERAMSVNMMAASLRCSVFRTA